MPKTEFLEEGYLTLSDAARFLRLATGKRISGVWVHKQVRKLGIITKPIQVQIVTPREVQGISEKDFPRLVEALEKLP